MIQIIIHLPDEIIQGTLVDWPHAWSVLATAKLIPGIEAIDIRHTWDDDPSHIVEFRWRPTRIHTDLALEEQ